MRWARLIGDRVNEITEGDSPADDAIPVPDDVFPIPGKWFYDTTRGFYPDAQQLQADMGAVVQNRLDDYAVSKGYFSILSAVSYSDSSNAQFKADGLGAREWRDACWSVAYTVLAAVSAGTMKCPTEDELAAMLPAPGW